LTAKSYLQQIKKCDIKIDNGVEELSRLKALATRVTSAMSGDVVSRTRNTDTLGDTVAKIIKLQDDLNREVDRYVDLKREVTVMLYRLENPVYYQILHSRYILYKTWEQIACDMDFTYQWVCELHGRALQEFGKLMEQ
jgi:hypothetical protein